MSPQKCDRLYNCTRAALMAALQIGGVEFDAAELVYGFLCVVEELTKHAKGAERDVLRAIAIYLVRTAGAPGARELIDSAARAQAIINREPKPKTIQ